MMGFLIAGLLSAAYAGDHADVNAEFKSPSELIKYLTYQSDRPDRHGLLHSLAFSCGPYLGEARDDRAIVGELVKLDISAVPAIDEAPDSLEANGETSEVALKAGWLLLAYARIKGPAAYPRLQKMIGNPRLGRFVQVADNSLAVALRLTSYVTSFREAAVGRRCDRGDEPKDALDNLILACERSDRPMLESTLGPQASAALRKLLKKRSWSSLHGKLWQIESGTNRKVQVGYRFANSGRWGEPDETLGDERKVAYIAGNYAVPEIQTLFTNRAGIICGKLRLRFSSTAITPWLGVMRYSVNTSDLMLLVKTIATCASDTGSPR